MSPNTDLVSTYGIQICHKLYKTVFQLLVEKFGNYRSMNLVSIIKISNHVNSGKSSMIKHSYMEMIKCIHKMHKCFDQKSFSISDTVTYILALMLIKALILLILNFPATLIKKAVSLSNFIKSLTT